MGVFKRRGNWFIDYYVGRRRVRERVGSSKGEAIRALAIRQAQVVQERFELPRHRTIPTFKQFAIRYMQFAKASKRGFRNEKYRIEGLVRRFGNRRLTDLSAWDAERLKAERSKEAQPATVNRELGNLKHMMTKAIEWGYLQKNPFAGVKLLRVPRRPERVLTEEEERKLLAACDKVRGRRYLKATVQVALNTGMRKGEIFSLQWSQVDFAGRTIHILNAKSRHGERHVPMNDTVYEALWRLNARRDGEQVFPSARRDGDGLRDHKKGFCKAVKLAGIPHTRFHDLRHTFATRLVRSGADLITVQHLLGHANITMTSRYAHALKDDKIAAVRRLEAAKRGSQPDPNRPPGPDLGEGENRSKLSVVSGLGV